MGSGDSEGWVGCWFEKESGNLGSAGKALLDNQGLWG